MPPRYQPSPDVDYPLAYRLAQFLLGAGDAVGEFGQSQARTSAGASDILESQSRQDIAREEIERRRREDTIKSQDRANVLGQQQQAAQEKARRRTVTSGFVGDVGGGMTIADAVKKLGEGASDLEPDSYKFMLEQLAREGQAKREPKDLRPRKVSPGEGVLNESTGGYDVPIPEAAKPGKPFFEGKTTTELELILSDPSTPPDVKAQVETAINRIGERDLKKARETGAFASEQRVREGVERATGPQSLTADERQRLAEGERSVQLAQRSLATLAKNPSWAGGPLGLQGRGRQWQSSLGTAPEGFAQFESDVAEIYGTYARRIAGAALTPTEKTTYLQYLPNLKTDSSQQFQAKLQVFPERVRVIDAALERARLGTGAPSQAAPPTTQRKPDFRYNPATGQLEPVQ